MDGTAPRCEVNTRKLLSQLLGPHRKGLPFLEERGVEIQDLSYLTNQEYHKGLLSWEPLHPKAGRKLCLGETWLHALPKALLAQS